MPSLPSTLRKEERIYSKKTIDALFQGGKSQSMLAFPLRVIYMPLPNDFDRQPRHDKEATMSVKAQFLISVPKRCFKHAVKRNRVKRQVREAYRKNKVIVAHHNVAMAFIWLSDSLYNSSRVEATVINLLNRVNERLSGEEAL
ncbi:ribonuclease P protein component [Hallella colorans]|uniref:ribonuclease P protein component n=1 Tax=Hallella colorans TaxID=1703337 RepID=UPI0023F0FC14|nr:ribonuclease P protein component [Hallella colorans]